MIVTRDRTTRPAPTQMADAQFRADVLRGLAAPEKQLPCKYFYDEAGSDLFEQITTLDEYYPTRTELAIMRRHASAMAEMLGPRCLVIEFGSGSSSKTRLLLDHLQEPAGYVPIDIAHEQLFRSAQSLAEDYPHLEVLPLHADFSRRLTVPSPRIDPDRQVVYFPGSTIGNFTPEQAVSLLRHAARMFGANGGMLLGADLQKDAGILEAAYNDNQGVTAAFNCNLLVRINRELDADFDLSQFAHRAFYNASAGRIEMHLESRCAQRVRIDDREFNFACGESIRTEYSYKYSLGGLHDLASAAGLALAHVWTDSASLFSVNFLSA